MTSFQFNETGDDDRHYHVSEVCDDGDKIETGDNCGHCTNNDNKANVDFDRNEIGDNYAHHINNEIKACVDGDKIQTGDNYGCHNNAVN